MNEQNDFVNIVNRINNLAQSIIRRCGKEWADQAFNRGVLTINERDELKALITKRDDVCHGLAGVIQITPIDVQKVQRYLEIMRATSSYFTPKKRQGVRQRVPHQAKPTPITNNTPSINNFDWNDYMHYKYGMPTPSGKPVYDPWGDYMRKMYSIPSKKPKNK